LIAEISEKKSLDLFRVWINRGRQKIVGKTETMIEKNMTEIVGNATGTSPTICLFLGIKNRWNRNPIVVNTERPVLFFLKSQQFYMNIFEPTDERFTLRLIQTHLICSIVPCLIGFFEAAIPLFK
jgi:hypothetical protein